MNHVSWSDFSFPLEFTSGQWPLFTACIVQHLRNQDRNRNQSITLFHSFRSFSRRGKLKIGTIVMPYSLFFTLLQGFERSRLKACWLGKGTWSLTDCFLPLTYLAGGFLEERLFSQANRWDVNLVLVTTYLFSDLRSVTCLLALTLPSFHLRPCVSG